MTPSSKHWGPGSRGYVIRSERHYDAQDGRKAMTHISYWQGPAHGWGTTYSALSYGVAVFLTRQAAEKAYRSIYGRMTKDAKAQSVPSAEAESKARWNR